MIPLTHYGYCGDVSRPITLFLGSGAEMEPEEMSEQAMQLIHSFCERRNFTALRQILRGYPIGGGGLTDDWA